MRVQEILLVMCQAPCGQDRAATRDNAGDTPGSERHVGQAYTRMDRKIIHSLLCLLNQRIAIDLPGKFLGLAPNLFECLVDRYSANGYRSITDDPFTGRMDVFTG